MVFKKRRKKNKKKRPIIFVLLNLKTMLYENWDLNLFFFFNFYFSILMTRISFGINRLWISKKKNSKIDWLTNRCCCSPSSSFSFVFFFSYFAILIIWEKKKNKKSWSNVATNRVESRIWKQQQQQQLIFIFVLLAANK